MILEMRTTRYVPGVTAKVNAEFEKALPARSSLSNLGGLFHVDIGVLNTTIELWPYVDEDERAKVLQMADQLEEWPPALSDVRISEETAVLKSAPSNVEFETGAFGGVYEFRIYHLVPGTLQQALTNFGEKIGPRAALSPFIGLYYSDDERSPYLVHIWAYQDGAARTRIRADAIAQGLWPPALTSAGLLIRQESVLTTPAPVSPLH